MVYMPSLPQPQRLLLAELAGTANRYSIGEGRGLPQEVAVAAVRAITDDPVLLGIQAGVALADPYGVSQPTVELLQAAGADMTIAQQHATEVRERLERIGISNSSDGGAEDGRSGQRGDGQPEGQRG
ncbi:hypothetical protein [Salinispora vitiensis]|uniref:hypothetical protein n=1 Tax=Salinispora vitiensis TaxID=999544 RepID=UPI00037977FF|nr:hypothetical protein [Salinispora vitiensis]